MINYYIKIDPKSERTYYSDIEFTSGDVRAYKFLFQFAGIDTSECTLAVKAKRADGNIVIAKSDVCNEFIVPSNMYCTEGELYFEIALYNASGGNVVTKVIAASVREGFGEEGLSADDRYPILNSLISEVNSLKLKYDNTFSETGDISEALDNIIAIQEALIGGESA